MAKIIIMSIPGHGHVNPTLPVVQELIQRGHQVIYYNTAEFAEKIERSGAEFRAYPEPVPTSAEISRLLSKGNMVRVTLMLFRMSEHLVAFMLDELRREQPNAVIHDSLALWASISATRLGMPRVTSITHFVFDGVKSRRTKREWFYLLRTVLPLLPSFVRTRRRLTRRYGREIFPKGPIFPLRGDLNILFTAECLQPASTLIDDSFRYVGPSINGAVRGDGDFPFDQLVRRPLVYISLGTVHSTDTGFYHKAFRAFADHPGQFVLSVGAHTRLEDLQPIPANFIVRHHVPQLEILQQADVFVTHGGMNSVHEALYFGVPLVVIPHQFEQLFNGRVVESKSAGVLLAEKPPFGRVSAQELRAAVDRVLAASAYRENARIVSEELAATGGYLLAADEIERLVQPLIEPRQRIIGN